MQALSSIYLQWWERLPAAGEFPLQARQWYLGCRSQFKVVLTGFAVLGSRESREGEREMKRILLSSAACLFFVAALYTPAFAGWTVTYLNPSGASGSLAYGVSGGQQVGWAKFGSESTHPSLWTGTAASYVDLGQYSIAFAVSGGQQVGDAIVGGNSHASLWTGTAASWVDLNPSGATSSAASKQDTLK